MTRELTGDEPPVFTPEEQATIDMWESEEWVVFRALQEGAPPWQVTPLERIPAGTLTPEEIAKAEADPDRMTMRELAAEEAHSPLLRHLREGGGAWLQAETIRRLEAIHYWDDQERIAASDAAGVGG